MKARKIIKWSLIVFVGFILAMVGFGAWFMGLVSTPDELLPKESTKPTELVYLSQDSVPYRGRILAVVTSIDTMGSSGKPTGYELTELSRAYYVFTANGFEVDIASTKGGKAPVMIDDMGAYDYAFLNDKVAQTKITHTIPINEVKADDYAGIYFVGGKGAMFDFPDNTSIQTIVRKLYEQNKVIGAVCHGPAALTNVKLSNGQSLVNGKHISSFTNAEELLLIGDAREIFPFLLQDKLELSGARFEEGIMYLENVVRDGSIITGQNPWSTWLLAETMVEQLGYEPKPREITGEENAVSILKSYELQGYKKTKAKVSQLIKNGSKINKELLGAHAILAAWQLEMGKAYDLIGLLRCLES